MGNIDPETLRLPAATRQALASWAQDYDRTLNRSDPIQCGFSAPAEEIAVNMEGWR